MHTKQMDLNMLELQLVLGHATNQKARVNSLISGRTVNIHRHTKLSRHRKLIKLPKIRDFTTPAAETPQCLKCHVLGKDIDPAELESTFNKEDGVQCETCHGPGSEYKKLTIMKDKQKAKG